MSQSPTAITNRSVRADPRVAPWILLSPFLGLFALFAAVPLARSLWLTTRRTFGPGASEAVGFENFTTLLEDPTFTTAVKNTVVFTAGSILTQIPAGLGLALLLNSKWVRGRTLLRLCFFAPNLVGLVVLALLATTAFAKQTGLMNQSLHTFFEGWSLDFPWLDRHPMATLLIAAFWMYTGFQMIYMLAALQSVDESLLEQSRVDGAGALSRFRHVTLPEIQPVAGFVTLLSIIGGLQLFELPWLLFDGPGPENRALTIVGYLYRVAFEQRDLGYASTIGWALTSLLAVCALLAQPLMRSRK